MKLKTLAIGALGLAVLAGGGWLIRWAATGSGPAGRTGQTLMDAVDLSAAARIEMAGATSHTTFLALPGGWAIAEQGNYPADQGKLTSFLLKLSEQKIADKVTENPENFADLGVMTVEENGNKPEDRKTGTLFRVLDSSSKPLYQLLIGHDRAPSATVSAYGGQYIRFPQEKAVFLIGTTLFAETEPKEWIDKKILPPDAEKLFKRIRVERSDKKALAFSREQQESPWQLDGATQRGLNVKEIDNLSKKLRDLETSQIAPADKDAKTLGRDKLGTVEARLFDGRAFHLDVGDGKGPDNLRYVTVRETVEGSAPEALKQQAQAFNARFKDRILGIPEWDASRLMRERKEYLQGS